MSAGQQTLDPNGTPLSSVVLRPRGDDGDGGDGGGNGDENGDPGEGGGSGGSGGDGVGHGECGSGAGGDPAATNAAEAAAVKEFGDLPIERTDEEWANARRAEAKQIEQYIDDPAPSAGGSGRGTAAGNSKRWADDVTSPKQVRWEKYLKNAVNTSLTTARKEDYTYKKPGRRSTSYRGAPVFPSMRGSEVNVCVVVDTSGSMGSGALGLAATETAKLLKVRGVSKVFLIPVDTQAHQAATRVFNKAKITTMLKGGGGTDMGVGLEAAAKIKPAPKMTVVFTDGGTRWPKTTPLRNVVIVLVPEWDGSKVAESTVRSTKAATCGYAKVAVMRPEQGARRQPRA